ncbi:putative rna-dependent rna polymerase [Diplodia seriata]|uniref:RNA-dependent RNA polymerase n=1 Tax=Diplodia seriata TaxID=420778 RepID=A0A0G2HF98_9PEZI|nr:putative rna-dependent rna polymerase [Diplodia seriata]
MVIRLLPAFEYLAHKEGPTATTMAIQMLARQIPIPGPDRDPNSLDDEALYWSLRGYAEDFKLEGSIYDEKSWNTNQCALVHRVMITPAGTYLEGPELEAGNRVLRQYRDYADRFLRVEFTDEDGDYVRFEPRTDMSDIFNTRFQGVLDNVIDIADRAKGMVSLDNRLKGEQLILRPSMVKFEGSKTWDIEVCGANFKPLPMYLNRSLVKILEDLGVPAENFLELEDQMIEQIRRITESPINAAIFLETSRIGLCTRLPFLFRALDDLGLSFGGDSFLSRIVEIAVLSQLRDVKYRARIPVEEGVTLYGIMDETGFLEEGEIFCTFERPGEKGKLEQHVLTGNDMLVTRSPAMHPGDVQKVRAVEGLPADSPLRHLSNVVVFSQKGQRDLPSQLSGGDLDGDLYNVIWDERLIPPTTHAAADYNPMPPMDIGRPVTQTDITQFFVKFMETDQLGRISMIHMQLADRAAAGTLDPACKKLAEMASTAVDFSKTGIPVDMSQCPRYDMIRPDFMATSPHVPVVRKDGVGFVDAADQHNADDDDDDADAVEALDPDLRSYKYYESDRVLGRLYRAIDEKTIFEDMHRRLRNSTATTTTPRAAADDGTTLLSHIWNYILRETALIQWESYMPLAREIREIYESNLLDAMSDFSAHPRHPLSEIEILGGNIIGRSGGSASRRVRERTAEMNKRFERDAAFVVQRIVQGDDGDRDEGLARSLGVEYVRLKMGFDCGFDIYPRLDPTPSNKEKYAHFINEVLRTYEDEDEYGSDSVVEVVPDSPGSHIEFLVGEHPAIPYNCEYFLRFSSKVSGKDGAQVERYIKEVCKMATKSWKEVNESWRTMKEPK